MHEALEAELLHLHEEVLTGLADPRRLRILVALGSRPMSAHELALELGLDAPSVAQHVKVMRERGLILASAFRGETRYEVSDERLLEAIDLLRGVLRDWTYRRTEKALALVGH
jgi:ArsR family transcriptional regulator